MSRNNASNSLPFYDRNQPHSMTLDGNMFDYHPQFDMNWEEQPTFSTDIVHMDQMDHMQLQPSIFTRSTMSNETYVHDESMSLSAPNSQLWEDELLRDNANE